MVLRPRRRRAPRARRRRAPTAAGGRAPAARRRRRASRPATTPRGSPRAARPRRGSRRRPRARRRRGTRAPSGSRAAGRSARPPSAIARNEGANAIAAASSAPPIPAAAQPTSATVCVTGPGVSWPKATAFRNSVSVIQPWRSTASSCISGMITKPPPYESAPTLNAVHASPGSAAAAAITNGQACSATCDAALPGELEEARGEQHEHHVRAREHRGGEAGGDVGGRTQVAAPGQRTAPEPDPGLHDDGDHGRAGARADAEDPLRRRVAERDRRDREHHRQPGQDEREPAGDPAGQPGDPLRAVDRQLRRGRPRQQLAGRVRVLELARADPAAALDDELAQQRDVRRRPAEADQPEPAPLAEDCAKRDVHGRGGPYCAQHGTAVRRAAAEPRGRGAAARRAARRADAPAHARRLRRAGAPARARLGAADRDRVRAAALDGPVRPAGHRQDDARAHDRRARRRRVRGALRRQRGPPRGARGDRTGEGAPSLRPADDLLPRRDPPLQQGAAGRAAARRRGGTRDARRRHDREPVLRGQLGAAQPRAGVRAARAERRRRRGPAAARARRRRMRRRDRRRRRDRVPGRALRRRRARRAERARAGLRDRGAGGRGRRARDGRRRRGRDAAQGRAVRQGRRPALRLHLRLDQVDARLRSRRVAVLPRGDARGRRGSRATSRGG